MEIHLASLAGADDCDPKTKKQAVLKTGTKMSSEAETKSGVLSSIRKLLGGDETKTQESDSEAGIDAGADEATLVLTVGSVEARDDGVPEIPQGAEVTDAEDGGDLVLDPTMRAQALEDTTTTVTKGDDPDISLDDSVTSEAESAGAASDGDVNKDAGSALPDIGLEGVGPSSVNFSDDFESDRGSGEDGGDNLTTEGGEQQDFDPTVWPPVLSDVEKGADAGDADDSVAALEDDGPEEAIEELATQVDDDKLEEMPVSDQSEDDKETESASEVEGETRGETPEGILTEEPGETADDAPEDFQELLEDTIRRILREELSGDMGQRLSQNIQKMIRDQVAEAMPPRA